MKICNNFHPEVCFEGGGACPVCEVIFERDAVLAEKEADAEALGARIVELLDERDSYRSELRL